MVNSTQDISIKDETSGNYADVTDNNELKTTAKIEVGEGAFIQIPPNTFVNHYVGTQINTNLITPTAGKKLVIYGVQFDTDIAAASEAFVSFVSGAGTLVWNSHFDKQKAGQGWMPLNITGGTNESLVLNTAGWVAIAHLFVCISYGEVD